MLGKPFVGDFEIGQLFGMNLVKYYFLDGRKGHGGVDFPMPNGTPLIAACDGEVIFTTHPDDSPRTGWGLSILSDEVFKYNGQDCRLSCLYAHLKEGTLKVKRGDRVKQGDLIAESNNTGQTTGPHLHFATAPVHPITRRELALGNGYGSYIDPLPYLDYESPRIKRLKELQEFLNKHGASLKVDGKFGKLSKKALEKFLS